LEAQIAFYRLSRKVVNQQEAIPEDARRVMYYSLAIGHHVGVMDCFDELMSVPAESYEDCLQRMPDGEGRRKLAGVLRWSEIEINRGHVDELLPALSALPPGIDGLPTKWVQSLIGCLQEMVKEPALYLMVKARQ
jgi:hydrogenase-4 component J